MKTGKLLFMFLALMLFFGFATVSVSAQNDDRDKPRTEHQDDDDDDENESPEAQKRLAKQAKISKEQAKKIALERVPGKVIESEIDMENGLLVWEFEIKDADGKVFEVLVDAKTGEIVAVEDESDEDDDDDPPYAGN